MKSILIIIPLFFIGCVNKKGISFNYYPECKEYYDLYGVYKEKCENNVYNFSHKKSPPLCLRCR
ncbi:MAG: hypothetical protein ABGX26_04610 [Nautiliaceae bacterium]